MSHAMDVSMIKDTPYLVDSWNPPMAYGSAPAEPGPEPMDESKVPNVKKSKQLVTVDTSGPWNSSNFVARSLLPMSTPDQPQRVAFADSFKHSKKSRAIVSSKQPPAVLAFSFAETAMLNSLTVNLNATMLAACYDTCTVISNLHAPSEDGFSNSATMYNSVFLPHEKHVTLPTGRSTLCASFAPDSPVVLTGTSRGQVALWSVEGSQRLVSYTGHTSQTPVWDINWAPSALYFGTGSGDGAARIWRSDIPFPIRILTVPDSKHVRSVKWHPSCQLVGVVSAESVLVYEISGPKILFTIKVKASVTAIEFSPTGLLLAIATSEDLSVWELHAGSRIFHHDCFASIVSLAWSFPSNSGLSDGGLRGSNGPVLLSVENTGRIRLWDKLFISKPSVCELFSESIGTPMCMHFTTKNLLVVASA